MHNDYRHRVMNCELHNQPPAKYLPDLQWDNDLAYYAQLLADRCVFEHDEVKLPQYERVGQNIAIYWTIEKAVDAWFNEYKEYDYYTGDCYEVCGHYTQMVWQKTTHVGCGLRNCTQYLGYLGLSIICNYGEGGNWGDDKPYETKPRSECGKTPAPVRTTPKPTVTTTTTKKPTVTPTRKPSAPKKTPKPDWATIISTWSKYATTQRLQGAVTQTCVCVN
ncbi:unnamed protein product [Trichobilharzia szidati]|nr:unnamed protein product [Trichobilharzia szidati]